MSCSLTPVDYAAPSENGVFSLPDLGPPLLTPAYFSAKEWIVLRERDKEADAVDSDRDISVAMPSAISNASVFPSSILQRLEPPADATRTRIKNFKTQQKRNAKRAVWQEKRHTSLKQRSYHHIKNSLDRLLTTPTSFQRDHNPTKPAWIGCRDPQDWNVYPLDELADPNGQWKMKVINWDGK